jgi:hypothetical protein
VIQIAPLDTNELQAKNVIHSLKPLHSKARAMEIGGAKAPAPAMGPAE